MTFKEEAIKYINDMSESKIYGLLDYIKYVHQKAEDYPLDDFDYELSRRADEAIASGEIEFTDFDKILAKRGLTRESLDEI